VTNLLDSGPGSLRQAILDTAAGGTVDFQPGLSGTITLTSGELAINNDLTIAGPGADVITVSGNYASRVFDIAGMFHVGIAGLTIANGTVSHAVDSGGGGIYSSGTLTISNCTLSGNSATGGVYRGGGSIYSSGTLTISNCTLSGNFATGGAPGGGGISNDGTLTVSDSTLSGNSASGFGGGISHSPSATVPCPATARPLPAAALRTMERLRSATAPCPATPPAEPAASSTTLARLRSATASCPAIPPSTAAAASTTPTGGR
jgi:predicted outer membrane repeat protein